MASQIVRPLLPFHLPRPTGLYLMGTPTLTSLSFLEIPALAQLQLPSTSPAGDSPTCQVSSLPGFRAFSTPWQANKLCICLMELAHQHLGTRSVQDEKEYSQGICFPNCPPSSSLSSASPNWTILDGNANSYWFKLSRNPSPNPAALPPISPAGHSSTCHALSFPGFRGFLHAMASIQTAFV